MDGNAADKRARTDAGAASSSSSSSSSAASAAAAARADRAAHVDARLAEFAAWHLAKPPPTLLDVAWLLPSVSLEGYKHEAGAVLATCREAATDSRILERLAVAVYEWGREWCRRTRLAHAAEVGNVARIKQLLAAGAKVDGDGGRRPLYEAVKCGHADAARVLIDAGADVTSFHLESCRGWTLKDTDKAAARSALLLELAASTRAPPVDVLQAGIKWDSIEAVKASVEKGIGELNAMFEDDNADGGGNFESDTISYCSVEVAAVVFPRLLHSSRLEMFEHCGDLGAGARDVLRTISGFPVASALFVDGDMYAHEPSTMLYAACGTGDLDLIKLLLPRDDVALFWRAYVPWRSSTTSLMLAASHGHKHVVRYILDHPPASFDQDDADTSLIACAMADDVEYASRLLVDGAQLKFDHRILNDSDKQEKSALRVACVRANVDLVKLLLEAGAELTSCRFFNYVLREYEEFSSCELRFAVQPERDYIRPPLPPPSADEDSRRVEIIRLLVAAGGSAAGAGIEEHPLYLRAFPKNGNAAREARAARRRRGGE